MKEYLNKFLITLLLTGIISGCEKSNPPIPVTSPAKCAIKTETSGLSGNSGSLGYEFDTKGNLSLIKVNNSNGSLERTIEFGSQTITISGTYLGKTNRRIT